ncbi:MAG: hypothetical protein JNN05_02300 [Candidatus Omnitrophica bacterium]|nr:hypothetical protein [Candidatus Omnitrophota bacterium]
MLSTAECKKHLNNTFTDEEVEQIRASLYSLADLFIAEYQKSKKARVLPSGAPDAGRQART